MRWNIRKLIHFAVMALGLFATPALAMEPSDIPPSPIVKTQLLVNASSSKAGSSIDAAVTFTMPEHWHIYWKNPGDSGIPTSLEWALPDGLTASDIAWPAPERIETSGLINYGYSNQVTLPVTLTANRNDIMGEVKVTARWLVCKEICIPESADLSAPLAADSRAAAMIAQTKKLVPQPFDGQASFQATANEVILTLTRDNPWQADAIRFSPFEDGIMANASAITTKQVGNELTLTVARGSADIIADWHGVLHLTQKGDAHAWDVTLTNRDPVAAATADEPANAVSVPIPVPAASTSLIAAIILAFIGGLILNIMPCVLPILALKALALSKKAAASRAAAAKQGFSYTAGVIVSFMMIAVVMLALKSTGAAIGWGFQLQNPAFVALLAAIMLLVSANLFGLFELPVFFGEKATGVDDSKLSGSFLTGALAVMVATPCTAPFMATAIGATLAFPAAQALVVFAFLGLGMASPFLIISLWPAARRLLPKPGAWMHRFKQILAIPMLATAAWLIWVLVQILNPTSITTTDMHEPFSQTRLTELREEGKPVLVDATAAWCITCKINERIAIKPPEMQQFLREKNVTILIADWTNSDPAITEYLALFGRNGVPLYVYYAAGAEPVVLPQVLSPAIVREAIENPLP